MRRHRLAAREQMLRRRKLCFGDPRLDRIPCLLGKLELHELPGLLLNDAGAGRRLSTEGRVPHPQTNEVAAPESGVQGQIEQSQVPDTPAQLEPDSYCPDLSQFLSQGTWWQGQNDASL